MKFTRQHSVWFCVRTSWRRTTEWIMKTKRYKTFCSNPDRTHCWGWTNTSMNRTNWIFGFVVVLVFRSATDLMLLLFYFCSNHTHTHASYGEFRTERARKINKTQLCSSSSSSRPALQNEKLSSAFCGMHAWCVYVFECNIVCACVD